MQFFNDTCDIRFSMQPGWVYFVLVYDGMPFVCVVSLCNPINNTTFYSADCLTFVLL